MFDLHPNVCSNIRMLESFSCMAIPFSTTQLAFLILQSFLVGLLELASTYKYGLLMVEVHTLPSGQGTLLSHGHQKQQKKCFNMGQCSIFYDITFSTGPI